MADVRGVILDVDGTLIDSNDAHAHAWVEVLAEAGLRVEYKKVRRLIGMGGDKLLPAVTGIEKDSEQGQKIAERRRELFMTHYLSSIKPFPETRHLLERMREAGLELVVASSAEGEELESLLEIAGVEDLVEARASSSDAKQSKPDPDIVHAAIQRIESGAGELIMLGDTPYDIEAATKAGVRIVALRSGGWMDEDLEGAIAIYQDPADLLTHFADSPFAPAHT
jgi:HAD superfamily hydrolase (TIGR01549 family)